MPISKSTYEQLENIKTVDDLNAVIERAVEVPHEFYHSLVYPDLLY